MSKERANPFALLTKPKRWLITGGTGFLGHQLCADIAALRHEMTVLIHNPKHADVLPDNAQVISSLDVLNEDAAFDIIVNLAGHPIAQSRWSEKVKKLIRDSRLETTSKLNQFIDRAKHKPDVFISGSAVGYYGIHKDKVLTEADAEQPIFSSELCFEWESIALSQKHTRVCVLRTGLVLEKDGGLLKRMLPAFKMCLGGRFGDGEYWMSWIHRDDWLGCVAHLIYHNTLSGPYNLTAPNPVKNKDFVAILAKSLHRKALFPVPAFLLRIAFGEMAEELLLAGQRVYPERLLESGYEFKFSELAPALKNIL